MCRKWKLLQQLPTHWQTRSSNKLKLYCLQVFHTPIAKWATVLFCYLPNEKQILISSSGCWTLPNASLLFLPPVKHQTLFFLTTLPPDLLLTTAPTTSGWSFLSGASLLGRGFICLDLCWSCWMCVGLSPLFLEFCTENFKRNFHFFFF